MDEIILKIARAMANHTRLQILSYLVRQGESAPTKLVTALGVPMNALCGHLAKLTSAGLLLRRRSGTWSYCLADSPYGEGTPSGKVMAWLTGLLRAPKQALEHYGPHEVRNVCAAEAEARLHDLIYNAATAFTDLRRLQILRLLGSAGPATAESLSRQLSMSDGAVSRQTTKLVRRGYLECHTTGRRAVYRLTSQAQTPIHAVLLEIVAATWEER